MSVDKQIQSIREALSQVDKSTNWVISGPIVKSRECDIYKASLVESALSLAVKAYSSKVKPSAPQQQFNALTRCQDAMSDESLTYRVPKVFACDKDKSLLIMEWVEGKSLHSKLWTFFSKKDVLYLAGQWLRVFHESSAIELAEVKFMDYCKEVEKRAGIYPENLLKSDKLYVDAVSFLQKAVADQAPNKAPHALIHGDFTPHNLLIVNKHIVGLDLWATVRKPVLRDVVRMIVYLTVAYPQVMHECVRDGVNPVQKSIKPFIEGYGKDLIEIDSSHFKIALLSEYLRRWLVIASRSRKHITFLVDTYQLRQIKKQVSALLKTF